MAGSEAEGCRATSREEPAFGCLRNPRAGASSVTVPEGRKSLGQGWGGRVAQRTLPPAPDTHFRPGGSWGSQRPWRERLQAALADAALSAAAVSWPLRRAFPRGVRVACK